MGYQRPSKLTKGKESRFLNLIYSDLEPVISRFDTIHPFVRQVLLRDIATVMARRCKQSFKNGLAIGRQGQKRPE